MAIVKTYSLAKDGDISLSKNFKVREFRCKDGADKILICQETVNILQDVRDYFGKSITINSAYRTPAHNRAVGGASASQHVVGTACDIVVSGVPTKAVVAYLEAKYPNHGIGYYSSFTHIDSRGKKSYWKDKGSNVLTSFKLGKIYEQYKAVIPVKVETSVVKPTIIVSTKEEEEEMTQEQFNKMMGVYLSELSQKAPDTWSAADRQFAENNGLIKGDEKGNKQYKKFVTREEMAAMLHRFHDKGL